MRGVAACGVEILGDDVLEFFFNRISNEYKKNRIAEKKAIYNNWNEFTHQQKEQKLKNIVTTSLPKYIWIIEARNEAGELLFDYVYDTVEMKYDNTAILVNIFHDDIHNLIENVDAFIKHSFSIDHGDFKQSLLKRFITAARTNTKPNSSDTQESEQNDEQHFMAPFQQEEFNQRAEQAIGTPKHNRSPRMPSKKLAED